MLGRIVVGRFVKKFCVITSYQKSVRKARWHPQLPMIVSRERDRHRLSKKRRAATQVDADIKDLTHRHADQLALRLT